MGHERFLDVLLRPLGRKLALPRRQRLARERDPGATQAGATGSAALGLGHAARASVKAADLDLLPSISSLGPDRAAATLKRPACSGLYAL